MDNTYPDILQKLELLTKIQEFGSRALNVHTDSSDYDFVILNTPEIHDSLLELPECEEIDLSEYLQSKPVGNFTYYKLIYRATSLFKPTGAVIDLIAVDDESDLLVVTKAIEHMRTMQECVLSIKPLRVDIYRKLLIEYGWKENFDYNGGDYK